MANLTIQTRILLLALLPSTLLAIVLVTFSLMQARSLGQQGVDGFAGQLLAQSAVDELVLLHPAQAREGRAGRLPR